MTDGRTDGKDSLSFPCTHKPMEFKEDNGVITQDIDETHRHFVTVADLMSHGLWTFWLRA